MATLQEYKFKFKEDNFPIVIDALEELCKLNNLNPMIKIKMDDEHVLFYIKDGIGQHVAAMKTILFKVDDIIETDDDYLTIDYIILNGVNFLKNLKMLKSNNCKLAYRENDRIGSMLYISDDKIDFSFVSGDYTMLKDVTKEQIKMKMNPDLAEFSFGISKDLFTEVKKLSALNKNEVANFKIKDNKLYFFDKNWKYKVCDVKAPDNIYTFKAKYLKCIKAESDNDIQIHVFEQFILIKEDNVNLLIGLEIN